mgnify:FL=1
MCIRDSATVQELARKVEVLADPKIEEKNIREASILIETRDNLSYSHKVSAIKGSPQKPMSFEECMDKFNKCVRFGEVKMGSEKVSALIDCVGHLEDVEDINMLIRFLS